MVRCAAPAVHACPWRRCRPVLNGDMSQPITAEPGIRELREARGWTRIDFCIRVGASPGTIKMWERGMEAPALAWALLHMPEEERASVLAAREG